MNGILTELELEIEKLRAVSEEFSCMGDHSVTICGKEGWAYLAESVNRQIKSKLLILKRRR